MPKVCYSCGGPATTREHVPPAVLFPKESRTRAQLITVPSCKECNEQFSKDDEYFAACLSARWPASPAAEKVWTERIGRGIRRQEFQGLRKKLRQNAKRFTVVSGAKQVDVAVVQFDRDRILNVVRKIVRGLHYYHTNAVLPPESVIDVFMDPPDALMGLAETGVSASIDDDVVMYWWKVEDDISMWWLLFYKRTLFVAAAGPPEQAPQ